MNWLATLKARWQTVSSREQRLLLAALALVSLALLWLLAVAPALGVLNAADAQHLAIESQLQQMQRLQAQAKALQALPTLNPQETRRALDASLKTLGTAAQTALQIDRVTVTLKAVDAQALAQWLSNTRQNVHVAPTEAHLKRAPAGAWDGSVVFTLPAQ